MNQDNQTDHYILGVPTLNPEASKICIENNFCVSIRETGV